MQRLIVASCVTGGLAMAIFPAAAVARAPFSGNICAIPTVGQLSAAHITEPCIKGRTGKSAPKRSPLGGTVGQIVYSAHWGIPPWRQRPVPSSDRHDHEGARLGQGAHRGSRTAPLQGPNTRRSRCRRQPGVPSDGNLLLREPTHRRLHHRHCARDGGQLHHLRRAERRSADDSGGRTLPRRRRTPGHGTGGHDQGTRDGDRHGDRCEALRASVFSSH